MEKHNELGKKVLLVEDDASTARTYCLEFESSGFTVTQAFDGEEAFTKAKDGPDVIILDLMLPKISGLDALKKIKEDPQTKGIPVMALTNFGSDDNIKQSFELGAADFVMKYRVTPDELVTRVKRILGLPLS